ncbi:MAG: FAD-dependent monooxygenase [Gaiellaceae bacterium]|nr:FAD-dependent monooxygenase [Gaiellaceae bacterium]
MSTGRIAVVGAGPAGLATALAAHRAGFEVSLYERHPEVRAAGNILNLWPPPQKILRLLGVSTEDLGAPAMATFRRSDGKVRCDVRLPQEVIDEYGGGFIGLLRPGLYRRMLEALPEGVLQVDHEVVSFTDVGDKVIVHLRGHAEADVDVLVGADGISSTVRRLLWGDRPLRHHKLHLVGGYLFVEQVEEKVTVVAHNRTTQGSYSAIRHEGKWGYEWWVLEAFDPRKGFERDLKGWALERARGFAEPLPSLIASTPPEHVYRWEIRDLKPLRQWSKGRVTIVGDAAHPTSPYAAYGAGMAIEDGYFLAAELERVDLRSRSEVERALQAFEDRRKEHTRSMTRLAYLNGVLFHRLPRPLRPLRDLVFDRTPFLQKVMGDSMPAQILSQLAEIDEVEQRRANGSGARAPDRQHHLV